MRFSHFIFQVAGAASVINGRRIIGLAGIQLSMQASTRQARPLSVDEVSKLRKVASSGDTPLIDRVVASHFLLMIYGRCRASDTCAVQSINHDNDHKTGFVELATRQHKSSKSEAQIPNTKQVLGTAEFELMSKGFFYEKGKHLFDQANSLHRTVLDSRHSSRLLSRSQTSNAEAGPPARTKRCRYNSSGSSECLKGNLSSVRCSSVKIASDKDE